MSTEKKNFTSTAIISASKTYKKKLQKKWNEQAFEALLDLCSYAEQRKYYFEELQILLEMAEIFFDHSYPEEQFKQIQDRLYCLNETFKKSPHEFRHIFEAAYFYQNSPILNQQAKESLSDRFEAISYLADCMDANLHPELSFICGKALLQIIVLNEEIALEQIMETYFMIGTYLIDLQDFQSALYYYDLAYNIAKAYNDKTYQYIAIQRKSSLTITAAQLEPTINMDKERFETMTDLLELSDSLKINPFDLGEKLLEHEQKNLGEWTQYRCDRLAEALPMMNLMLSLSRGDRETSRKYTEQLIMSETKAYDSSSENSSAALLEQLFMALFDSPDREEAAEQDFPDGNEAENIEDIERHIDFPESIYPKNQFNYLLYYVKEFVSNNLPIGAESLSMQAIDLCQKHFSNYHIVYFISLMGQLYETKHNIELARDHYSIAIQLLNQTVELANSWYILKYTLHYLIGNLLRYEDPATSIQYLDQALNCNNIPVLFKINIILAKAEAYSAKQHWSKRDLECINALLLAFEEVKNRLPFVEGEIKEKIWKSVRDIIDRIVTITESNSGRELKIALYNAILCSKGFLLSSERSLKQAVYTEHNLADYIPLYERIQEYDNNKRKWGESTPDSARDYLNHYVDELRLLIAAKDVISKYYDFLNISYENIQNTLSPDDVVVEFFDYKKGDHSIEYFAFVYRKNDECPKFIRLCSEKDLQEIIDKVEQAAGESNHSSLLYENNLPFSYSLRDLIWTPVEVESKLLENESIYFIPSGSIHKIAIESLPDHRENSHNTLADKYCKFSRLSSTRQISQAKTEEFDNIVLFGGLDYGEDDSSSTVSRGYTLNFSDSVPEFAHPWGTLPMSELEVNQIEFICNSITPNCATKLTGANGSDTAFYSLSSHSPSIIHVASHGFCESPESAMNIPGLSEKYRSMDLSGLVFSNGNKGWLYTENNREGIVLASDIAQLDLSNTQLAVLSACYTGSGKVTSDGVYGLQRGLKKAGIKSIIMSLWNEADEVGYIFMTTFYQKLLVNNNSVNEAFYKTKTEIRKKYPDPAFWAGFILVD